MTAKYLCCLPLRLGVLVISFLQLIGSLLVSGVLAAALILNARDKDPDFQRFSSRTQGIIGVMSVLYGLVAIISLMGFIGAIRKKKSYVRIFLRLIQVFLAIQILVMIAYFILDFVDKNEFKQMCIGDSTDQDVINTCNSSRGRDLSVVIISAVLPILFSAYGVYIVAAYDKKLRSEEDYVKLRTGEEFRPLTLQVHPPAYSYDDHAAQKV